MFVKVSPELTVYVKERVFEAGFRADVDDRVVDDRVVVLAAASRGCGGVAPLIGITRVRPTFKTGFSPRLFA